MGWTALRHGRCLHVFLFERQCTVAAVVASCNAVAAETREILVSWRMAFHLVPVPGDEDGHQHPLGETLLKPEAASCARMR